MIPARARRRPADPAEAALAADLAGAAAGVAALDRSDPARRPRLALGLAADLQGLLARLGAQRATVAAALSDLARGASAAAAYRRTVRLAVPDPSASGRHKDRAP